MDKIEESTATQEIVSARESLFAEAGGKLLTFLLDGREYSIKILDAKEVVGIQNIDSVPRTPKYVKGVINLRGKIIPIIDLRAKFGMSEKESTKDTCIIVVEIDSKMTGIIVDQLIGVLNVNEEDYEATSHFGINIHANFIEGMVKLKGRVIIVLNCINILMSEPEEIAGSNFEESNANKSQMSGEMP